jgi:hypothetical protein
MQAEQSAGLGSVRLASVLRENAGPCNECVLACSPSFHLSSDGAGALDGLILLAAPIVAAFAHVRPSLLTRACFEASAHGTVRTTLLLRVAQNQAAHLLCQAAQSSLGGSATRLFKKLAAFIVPLLPSPPMLPEPPAPSAADMEWQNVSFLAHVDKVSEACGPCPFSGS